jgi:hypothetical protein
VTTNGAVTAQKRSRFADGSAVRLPLSDGDWVLVRAELSYAQQRRLAAAGLSGVPAALVEQGQGQALTVDLAAFDLERLCTWVMDWSFVDGDGDRVVVSRQSIEALTPEAAEEIGAALDAHIEALAAKKAARAPTASPGPSAPRATSFSAAPSAGAGRS